MHNLTNKKGGEMESKVEILISSLVKADVEKELMFKKFVDVSVERFKKSDWGSNKDNAETNEELLRSSEEGELIGEYKFGHRTIWVVSEVDGRNSIGVMYPDEH